MSDTAYSPSTVSVSEQRPRLAARVELVSALSAATRQQMWNVFSRYYDAVERPRFESDLREKRYAILLCDDEDGSIQGFSTVQLINVKHGGRSALVIYSGDTVIDQRYWGQGTLQIAFVRLAFSLKLRHPLTPVFYFLISKGYKTYLMLTRNTPQHWPRYEQETPQDIQQLMSQLAGQKFGAAWKPELGIVRFPECAGKIKAGVAPIDEKLLRLPEVRFFAERNPGHLHGDELVCLAMIDFRMMAHVLLRKLRSRS